MSQVPGSPNNGTGTRAFEGILELMSELFFASLEPLATRDTAGHPPPTMHFSTHRVTASTSR